ncbi:uncharacterized protein P884DRAFT_271381 [Thermothelomyces heterothallicus CBS 202.75]|uniref:uncharacterized protein n=1 Tax=Thermothelomyces heterothallicus CBS 202.75 TaxID=1149848 RepID=UPI003742D6D3
MIDPGDRLWEGSERKTFAVTYANPFPVEDVGGTEEICLAKLRSTSINWAMLPFPVKTIYLMAPQIDLVLYPEPPTARSAAGTGRSTGTGTGTTTTAAFKYWFMPNGHGSDLHLYEITTLDEHFREVPHEVTPTYDRNRDVIGTETRRIPLCCRKRWWPWGRSIGTRKGPRATTWPKPLPNRKQAKAIPNRGILK